MEELASFVNKRPCAEAIFGYGSGVFKQIGYDTKSNPQKDVIFLVKDIKEWHLENMERNPLDYSFIGRGFISHSSVERVKGYNKIIYFSQIREKDTSYKYGTIEEKDFLNSLKSWDNMFVAGRFQKPVLRIQSNENVDEVIKYDQECALRIACLLSPFETTVDTLLNTLCSLSYMGDTRMLFAENPNKVRNIVNGSFDHLKEMYMNKREYLDVLGDNVKINHKILLEQVCFLPSALVDYLASMDTNLSNMNEVRANIIAFMKMHNKKESLMQTVHGIKTNGLMKSVPYALSKVKKKIEGK